MRIVSLLPSATEIICAIGLEEQLIGVTHECDHPPSVRKKPKVTVTLIPTDADSRKIDALVRERIGGGEALYRLDAAALRELHPDLIVTQKLCDVCAVADDEVEAALPTLPGPPKALYLEPTTLDEVLEAMMTIGRAAGVEERARTTVRNLRQRIERVRAAARRDFETQAQHQRDSGRTSVHVRVGTRDEPPKAAGRPRVVVLEWLDPPFSCGHWTPQLVEIAGGWEPLARAGERSRTLSIEEIVAADPDALFIACCGYSLERTRQDLSAFLRNGTIAALRCVRERRVYAVDGSAYFSRPGPRLVDSLELLAYALDPGRHELPEGLAPAWRLPKT